MLSAGDIAPDFTSERDCLRLLQVEDELDVSGGPPRPTSLG